jgi:hypothetical protein
MGGSFFNFLLNTVWSPGAGWAPKYTLEAMVENFTEGILRALSARRSNG